MDRIQHPTAGAGQSWTAGDPATGAQPTRFTPEFVQGVQEELLTIIEQAGMVGDITDNTQVYQALRLLLNRGSNLVLNPSMVVNQYHGAPSTASADVPLWVCDRYGLQADLTVAGAGVCTATWNPANRLITDPDTIPSAMAGWDQPWFPQAYLNLNWGTKPTSKGMLFQRLPLTDTLGVLGSMLYLGNSAVPGQLFSGRQLTFACMVDMQNALTCELELLVNYGSGGSAREVIGTSSVFPTSALWQQIAHTFTIPDLSAKTWGADRSEQYLELRLKFDPGVGIMDCNVTNWTLQVGQLAPPVPPIDLWEEFARCAAFYETSAGPSMGDLENHPDQVTAPKRRYYLHTNQSVGLIDDQMRFHKRRNPLGTETTWYDDVGVIDALTVGGVSAQALSTVSGDGATLVVPNPNFTVAQGPGEVQAGWVVDCEMKNED